MALLPEQAPRWDEIDTVLLDLDGTLLDLAFDNYIWLARVAEIYAENNGLSLAETHAELAPRFKRVQFTVRSRTESPGCRAPGGFSSRFASVVSASCS